MNRLHAVLSLSAGFLLVVPSASAGSADWTLAAVSNTAYLASMPTRPWWDDAWSRRAPLLVSSTADAPMPNTLVDCVVDFGEAVNPEDVRVVTPWETSVDCVCEKVGDNSSSSRMDRRILSPTPTQNSNSIRLLFRTSLRPRENKPFLVYWGREKQKDNIHCPPPPASSTFSLLRMRVTDDEVRLSNGLLDIVFDNLHRTPGLIRSIHVVGSTAPNELMERATGYAWNGFSLHVANGIPLVWSKARVVSDNAFVKSVAFDSEFATMTFSLRAESRRLDYAYELKKGRNAAHFGISWGCGGGAAYDDIVYRGISGKDLATRAALDHCTDCMKEPGYSFRPYLSEGWLAIRDRRARDVVGFVFDRASLWGFDYWGHAQAAGESCSPAFCHRIVKDEPTGGAGALVALMGTYEDVRDEYLRIKDAPAIFVGKTQARAVIPVKIPRLDRDYIADYNLGPGAGAGWASGEPLAGAEWATNIIEHLRAYGANTVRIGNPNWFQLPVTKELYDLAIKRLGKRPDWVPEWPLESPSAKMLVVETAAAHAKGMAANIWGGYIAGFPQLGKDRFNEEDVKLDIELQNRFPKVGVDCVYNGRAQGEGPVCPDGVNRNDLKRFFEGQDRNTELVKRFCRESKKLNPDKPVVMWNSEGGDANRDMCLSDQAGFFDTCMVEIMPQIWDFGSCKYTAKRMRAFFDNEAGRTVHHHYFFFHPDPKYRVSNLEMPYICGVNGFSHENLTYENFDRELSEIAADFHRFTEYTGLREKVAKMAPVSPLGVFRDHTLFRHDVLTGATGGAYGARTRSDWRLQRLSQVPNFAFDIVVNRYFTAKALAKYRVVYVPENEVFSDACAEELVAYVKAGGAALLDGEKMRMAPALKALNLQDGKVQDLGKGKIVWVKPVMPDANWNNGWFRNLVRSLGAEDPYTLESGALDSILQSSSEGFFLGVLNAGADRASGRVTIRGLGQRSRSTKEENVHSPTPTLNSNSLFVLDVKNGIRVPYATNGFEVVVGPQSCGFYLIGDEKFTALPEVRQGVWTGARAWASHPAGQKTIVNTATNFTKAVAIEIAKKDANGHQLIRRSQDGRLERIRFGLDEYDPEVLKRALSRATYVHLRGDANAWDPGKPCFDAMFKDCADDLKALLKRGGGLLFDMTPPGESARAFLKEIGVDDPYATVENAKEDKGVWGKTVGKDHPLHDNLYQWRRFQMRRVFPKWSAEQTAPIRAAYDDGKAVVVTQDKVLGAGKVVFSENMAAFTDWYENREYGDRVISWFIGMPVKEHADKVELQNGGPGEVL